MSGYEPSAALDLTVVNSRLVVSPDDLHPDERHQLAAALHPRELEAAIWGSDEDDEEEGDLCVAAAEVVDAAGTLRYRLYGWNFGVGYLFPPQGLDVVAVAFQHDVEHWSTDQRDLFAAMDRAAKKDGFRFHQPLDWCWRKDECWDPTSERFNSQSQNYLRTLFAKIESGEIVPG